jgi:SAM-dependent methyltransferase
MSDSSSPNAREREYWNSAVTRPWSEMHDPIDRLFAELTHQAMEFAAPRPGEHVIDIGCGSGTTVIELANRVGRQGRVLGADISQQSVERARQRIREANLPQAQAELADVSTFDFPLSFDLAFSRFGVMFFANPTATFARLRQSMNKDGRLALAVFRTPKENPWGTGPVAAVKHLLPPLAQPGPDEPGQFSWADPARVRRILVGAGFRDVSLMSYDPLMRLAVRGGATEAADFAMKIGPVARALATGSVQSPDAVRSGLEAFFASHDGPEGIVLPGALWLVGARV